MTCHEIRPVDDELAKKLIALDLVVVQKTGHKQIKKK